MKFGSAHARLAWKQPSRAKCVGSGLGFIEYCRPQYVSVCAARSVLCLTLCVCVCVCVCVFSGAGPELREITTASTTGSFSSTLRGRKTYT